MKPWREVNQKPPLGAEIDWGHWRAKDCLGYFAFADAAGGWATNLAGAPAIGVGGPTWQGGGLYLLSESGLLRYADHTFGHSRQLRSVVVRFASPITYNAYSRILSIGVGSSPRVWWERSSGNYSARSVTGGGASYESNNIALTGWADGLGHQLSMIIDNYVVYAYGDGGLVGQTATRLADWFTCDDGGNVLAPSPSRVMRLGGHLGSTNYLEYAGGMQLDLVYLSAAALTAAQVREIYEEPYAGLLVPSGAVIFDMGGVTIHQATASDTIGLADAATALMGYLGAAADSIAAVDTAVGLGNYLGRATDGVGVADSANGLRGLIGQLADTVGVTDAVSGLRALVARAADGIGIGDALSGIKVHLARIADAVGLTDAVVGVRSLVARVGDTLGVADRAGGLRSLVARIADAAAISDSVRGAASGAIVFFRNRINRLFGRGIGP